MTPKEIRFWRPKRWSEFVGSKNQAVIQRLQRFAKCGDFNLHLLFCGPYGSGKTSLARHLVKAACCPNRNAETGDPCFRIQTGDKCSACCYTDPDHNGETHGERTHWEIDCTTINRPGVLSYLEEIKEDVTEGAVFWDEFQHLHDRYAKEPLLKIGEDYRGLFIVSVLDTELHTVTAALSDRFEDVRLYLPEVDELVQFFSQKLAEWQINATDQLIRKVVEDFGNSFRNCLRVFARVAEEPDRTLTPQLVEKSVAGRELKSGDDVSDDLIDDRLED